MERKKRRTERMDRLRGILIVLREQCVVVIWFRGVNGTATWNEVKTGRGNGS